MKFPRVLISASAGSGKTYRLVHHFLGILHDALLAPGRERQPGVVERILAATFTRAAAGEIIDRILKRVAESMLDPKERAALGAELGAPDLCEEECGKLLQAMIASLHRLRVCTLDSFLIRSSQAFSTELGLPDNWTILDDAADRAVAMEAVDQLLTEHAEDPHRSDVMLGLLISLNQGQYKLQIRERLLDHLRATQSALMAGPLHAWEAIGPVEGGLLDIAEFSKLAASLIVETQAHVPRTKSGGLHSVWVNALNKLAECAQCKNWDDLIKCKLVAILTEREPKFSGSAMSSGMVKLLQPLRDHAAANLLAALRDRNYSTRTLLIEFVREYRLAKLRGSAYRFDDFTQMLNDAGVTEDLGDFYFRLDGKIDHILLDEFQDTSIPQWKLIKPLVEEIMGGGEGAAGGERTFFCVGDIKQTLYGWRNAEPELLNKLTGQWESLQEQHLLISQRSAPVIIDTVNRIFGAIAGNSVLTHSDAEHAYLSCARDVWVKWFREHSTVHAGVPGFCRLITCNDGECAADKQQYAIKLAAERVSELHKARPDADIAVLLRRKRFIAPLLARLRRLDISASGEGGSPLADDLAVLAVLSVLHLIDHPSDTAAVFHVATSPLGQAVGIVSTSTRNDVLVRTTELRTEILDLGLGAAINRWMGLCASSCDARNFRRLQRLVTLAHGFDYDGGDLRPFIETVRASNIEDSDASRIRVMTIHASKGRQFDYVVLPDLDGKFIGFGPAVLMHRPELLGEADTITVRPSAAQAAVDERLATLVSDSRRRQLVEELCALYVGLTRAKSGLEMIVHPQASNSKGNGKLPCSPAGVLRAALTDGAAPPNTQLWAHENNVMPAGASPAPQEVTESLSPIQLHISPPPGVSRLRPQVSPSSLEGSGYIDLNRTFSFDQQYGLNWGLVMHRWFEMIEWLDEPIPSDNAFIHAARELQLNISGVQLATMLQKFQQFRGAPNINKLLVRATYLSGAPAAATVEVWRERSFAIPFQSPELPGGAIVCGQIDRVVIVRAAGKIVRAEVVDYKTDDVKAGGETETIAHYAPQVRAYRNAIAGLVGIDAKKVTAKIVFVGSDWIANVTP